MAWYKDIAGQKFGRLVAVERIGKDKNGISLWECKCECGGTATVAINNLTTGHTLSCGCYKIEKNTEYGKKTGIDLVGQKFGQLTVVEKTEERICGQIVWKCKCDCGNIVKAIGGNLKSGDTKRCENCRSEGLSNAHRKYNNYEISGQIVYVALSNCKDKMLCDLSDWEKMKKYCWSKDAQGYVVAMVNGKARKFHTLIVHCPKGSVRDHINRNKLDNRKENIRITSFSANSYNRSVSVKSKSGYTGVYKTKSGKWSASIRKDYKLIKLGIYENLEDAISARRKAEMEYFGEYTQ